MKIKYNNTEIDFFNFQLKQVILSLSGGADSTAFLYLMCKHFPDLEIIPFTSRDKYGPLDAIAAGKIIEWIKNEFPNQKIKDLITFEFDDRDPEFYKTIPERVKHFPKSRNIWQLNNKQISKILQIDIHRSKILENYPEAFMTDGMTANPPLEIQEKYPIMHKLAEKRRNPGTIHNNFQSNNFYKPFLNVDKKFVADVFKQNNLMDSLFKLTRSCVGDEFQTDNGKYECHRCFWCFEKKWAFDLEWDYNLVGPDVHGDNDIHLNPKDFVEYEKNYPPNAEHIPIWRKT